MSRGRNRWRERFEVDRPLIVAHRGDSAHAPENTLEAARLGRENSAEAWELDVRLTRDGFAVVIHDAELGRTTDAALRLNGDPRGVRGWPVAEFDQAELAELDAGSWFIEELGGPRSAASFGTREFLSATIVAKCRSGGVRVPTLRAALELTVELDWLVNVELKIDGDEGEPLSDAVLAEIDALGAEDRVLISSFDHEAVARIARSRPEIAAGVLSSQPLLDPGRYVREWIGADSYHASASALGRNVRTGMIGRSRAGRSDRPEPFVSLRRSAVPLLVFTVNDWVPNGFGQKLIEAGVSGMFSDDPGSAKNVS